MDEEQFGEFPPIETDQVAHHVRKIELHLPKETYQLVEELVRSVSDLSSELTMLRYSVHNLSVGLEQQTKAITPK